MLFLFYFSQQVSSFSRSYAPPAVYLWATAFVFPRDPHIDTMGSSKTRHALLNTFTYIQIFFRCCWTYSSPKPTHFFKRRYKCLTDVHLKPYQLRNCQLKNITAAFTLGQRSYPLHRNQNASSDAISMAIDDSVIHTTWYVPSILEAIYSYYMHGFRINMS